MAGDDGNNGLATAMATVGTVLWCIQLIPQVIRNWYVRDCEGVPAIMMFLFAACGVPFAIYFLVQTANTALIVQPHLFMFFSLIGFWQSLYYPPIKLPFMKCNIILAVTCAVFAGIEAGVTVPLRHLYNEGTHWPNLIPGIIASVLLAVGLLPPYWEMYKRHGQCVGINFVFLFLDSSGAIFSTVAVAYGPGKLDVLGLVLYLIVLGLEYGILTIHFIWMIRVRYFGLPIDLPSRPLRRQQTKATDENKIESKDTLDAGVCSISSEPCRSHWDGEGEYDKLDPNSPNAPPPPRTQPLRDWVEFSIVDPITRALLRLRLRSLKRRDSETTSVPI